MNAPRHRLPYAWILLGAFLPSITFAGHWDFAVPIPGTEITLGFFPVQAHGAMPGAPDSESHRDHCHVDASGCSDQPLVSGAPVAHLSDALALGASFEDIRHAGSAREVRPESAVTAPDIPPPRAA